MNFVLVFLGGGLGSVARYLLGLLFQKSSLTLPLATLASNLIACMVFAGCLSFIEKQTPASSSYKLIILTGFCGGLSTFSTFSYETWMLLRQQNFVWGIANIFISVVLCLAAFLLIKK